MSTNFQVGFVSQKNSSKVLKPPGGGSTDIFGGDVATTPRSIKNHMKSTIFAVPSPVSKTDNVRRQPADSHNRLFGDADRSCTPAKNRLKSNIPIGGDESDSSLKHSNGTNSSSREHVNGSENGKTNGCDYNENYIHSTETLNTSNAKPFGFDSSNCKSTNYLNPTYNSKINLCINDDYISIVDNVSDLTHKRESKLFDENMNLATPLINAHEPKISRKIHNNSLTGGNSVNGDAFKTSGENIAPANHVINKNRIPPGGFSSGLW